MRASACALALRQKALLSLRRGTEATSHALREAESAAKAHALTLSEPGIVLSPEQALVQVRLLSSVAAACRDVLSALVAPPVEGEDGVDMEEDGQQSGLDLGSLQMDLDDIASLEANLASLSALFASAEGSAVAGR